MQLVTSRRFSILKEPITLRTTISYLCSLAQTFAIEHARHIGEVELHRPDVVVGVLVGTHGSHAIGTGQDVERVDSTNDGHHTAAHKETRGKHQARLRVCETQREAAGAWS